MRSLPALHALGLAVITASIGCARLGPVPRYPWIEDRSLSLDAETLRVTVRADEVEVDALFFFRAEGTPADRVVTFPVAAPRGGALDFTATLEGPLPLERLPVARAAPGVLPAGEAAETWDIAIPGAALAAHGGVARVRYRQPGRGRFAYTLRTGAYWRGPIRALDVIVDDPDRRAAVTLEGSRLSRAPDARAFAAHLADVEPRDGLLLEITP
jgi:hypothetical protein